MMIRRTKGAIDLKYLTVEELNSLLDQGNADLKSERVITAEYGFK